MINKSGAKKLSSRNILGSKSKISGTLNLTENLQEKDNYMDSVVCKAATTTNIDLDGSVMTIDDVVLAANDIVLIKDQTDKTLNGVYFAYDTGFLRYDSIRTPTTASIELGTVNKELLFYQITSNYVIGASEIIYLKIDTGILPIGTEGQTLRYNSSNELEANSNIFNTNELLEIKQRGETDSNNFGQMYFFADSAAGEGTLNIQLTNKFEGSDGIPLYLNMNSQQEQSNFQLNSSNVYLLSSSLELPKIYIANYLFENNTDFGKYLKIKDNTGEIEFVDMALLPSGTENQILRHNGTDWVVANYTTLTDTATSSKLAIVNGTNPTLKNIQLTVEDSRSNIFMQCDENATSGHPYLNMTAGSSNSLITVSQNTNDFVSMFSDINLQRLYLTNQKGEKVYINANKTPVTTNENIYVQNATTKTFIVTNNGKVFTKQHPQIDTTEAAAGKVLVCTDADGNSQWQKKSDLLVQSANQEIPTTTPIAITDFQFTAKANKKYLVKYRIYILNTQDDWSPNIQIKIGDGTGAETAFGSLLARSLDNSSYYLYKDIPETQPKYNSLFDWTLGQNVTFFTNDYMHLDLEAVIEMGNTDKTVDLYITLPSTPTVPPNFTVRANSYLKYEMF